MATTADQLTPILKDRLKSALYELAEKGNVGGWRDHVADDIGVDRKTAENWFYGNNLPSLAGWVALCLRVPGLQQRVLEGITRDNGDQLDPIEMLEATIAELKSRENVVNLERAK